LAVTEQGSAAAAAAGALNGVGWTEDLHNRPDAFLLFTAGQLHLLRYPVWWYLDPDAKITGPWGAEKMLTWWMMGNLPGSLPVCGTSREAVGAGIRPAAALFRSLQELLKEVVSGRPYSAHQLS
jgi:hypothetical protein